MKTSKEIKSKICESCGREFIPCRSFQIYCTSDCIEYFDSKDVSGTSRSNTGYIAESLVVSDLMLKKYYVFQNCGPNSPFDLYAYKDGLGLKIEVKIGRVNKKNGRLHHNRPEHHEHDILAVCELNNGTVHYFDAITDSSIDVE